MSGFSERKYSSRSGSSATDCAYLLGETNRMPYPAVSWAARMGIGAALRDPAIAVAFLEGQLAEDRDEFLATLAALLPVLGTDLDFVRSVHDGLALVGPAWERVQVPSLRAERTA
ncbi:hypothetical protein [Streptomyces sp. NPDC001137]|uniref:hypothetical protein n=1 Tax=Streptomyces sp. NPDC001137 TaxID=3154378 RepID=UPI003331051D